MSENNKQVTPYQYTYQCDSCHQADVIPKSGLVTSPYQYICPNCNTSIELTQIYPRIEYK